MATRKQPSSPGEQPTSADADDVQAQQPQRLVLRSRPEATSVTFTGRRTESVGAAEGSPTRGRRNAAEKRWQPPEGLTAEEVKAVIAAAATERDRLLLRTL